jgi:uncharacterized protein with HEPN domain
VKEREPEVDWPGISRFRNVVAHGYLEIDLGEVWSIIQEKLPALKEAAARMRSEG